MAKERAECGSKSKKEDSQEDEVGSKRVSKQAKLAKALRPGPSLPSPPWKGFKMLPTGDYGDSEEEEAYPEQNVQATYAKAKFALIQPIIQRQTVQVEIEPRPIRCRAGQVITSTHQRFIDLSINSLPDASDEDSCPPDLESDHDDQESFTPKFEVQDDGIIEYMHNINTMAFPDEVIRANKQTGQFVPLHNIVCGPIEPTKPKLESWAVSDNGVSEAINMYEANDIWIQHGKDSLVRKRSLFF
jgi:hypothetical protein